jgi:hypothetical protein
VSGTNPLEMSDEDIMNQSAPPEAEEAASGETPPASEDDDQDRGDAGDQDDNAGTDDDDADAGASDPDDDAGADGDSKDGDEPDNGSDTGDAPAAADAEPKPTDDKPEEGGKDDAEKDDGDEPKSVGFTVPTTFKANGKDVQLKNADEATKLMQLGANYTKRMQELAPHRKVLMMLQNNEIDESKLSFLIDLDKKNPEAIKKLIQDSGIDPLEIDTSEDPNYIPGNHTVTDEQERFRSVVDEITSTPAGKETVLEVTKWDQMSKDAVWQSPEIMTAIHEQRESGVYSLISAEVDRRMTLGQIPTGTPFLEAYKTVGMEMAAEANTSSGASGSTGAEVTNRGAATPKVAVTTRAAAPKATVANGDKAKAASPSRATPSTAKPIVNVLAQDDDAFMKQMEGRV